MRLRAPGVDGQSNDLKCFCGYLSSVVCASVTKKEPGALLQGQDVTAKVNGDLGCARHGVKELVVSPRKFRAKTLVSASEFCRYCKKSLLFGYVFMVECSILSNLAVEKSATAIAGPYC